MQELTHISKFSPLINQEFHIALQDETLHFVLTNVSDLGYGTDGDGTRRAFSLLFRHDRTDAYLPQGTYKVQNEKIGDIDLFLVPLGPREDGMYYESVFT